MKVVNIKDYGGINEAVKAGAIYCGRPSYLGNPFTVEEYGRDEAIRLYKEWLWKQIKNKNKYVLTTLKELKEDSVLACFCTPKKCHCEHIISAWHYCKKEGII